MPSHAAWESMDENIKKEMEEKPFEEHKKRK